MELTYKNIVETLKGCAPEIASHIEQEIKRIRRTKEVPTLAVNYKGTLFINQAFWDRNITDKDDLAFCLMHELLHRVTGDTEVMRRLDVKDPEFKKKQYLLNVAMDMRINAFLVNERKLGKDFLYKLYCSQSVAGNLGRLLQGCEDYVDRSLRQLHKDVWQYGYKSNSAILSFYDIYLELLKLVEQNPSLGQGAGSLDSLIGDHAGKKRKSPKRKNAGKVIKPGDDARELHVEGKSAAAPKPGERSEQDSEGPSDDGQPEEPDEKDKPEENEEDTEKEEQDDAEDLLDDFGDEDEDEDDDWGSDPSDCGDRDEELLKRLMDGGPGWDPNGGRPKTTILRSEVQARRYMFKPEWLDKAMKLQKIANIRAKMFRPNARWGFDVSPSQPINRRDVAYVSMDIFPTFWKRKRKGFDKTLAFVPIYLDVSGSMYEFLPDILEMLVNLDRRITQLYGFSTYITEISRQDMIDRKFSSSGGTDFTPIFEHAFENQYRDIMVITDGECGPPNVTQSKLSFFRSVSCVLCGHVQDNDFFSTTYPNDTHRLQELV